MKSYFQRGSVDMIKYNKHYNPKNKYIEKNILFEIYYDIDEDDRNDVVFNHINTSALKVTLHFTC